MNKKSRSLSESVLANECVRKFSSMCSDFFSADARGVCLPRFPARDSHKYTAKSTGTFYVGANHVGFIALAPSLGNTHTSYYVSSGSFTGNQISDSGTPGVVGHSTNSPYADSDFENGDSDTPPNLSGRIVGAAIRIRYMDREDQRGGLMYAYVSPDHTSLLGKSISDIGVRNGCVKIPTSREWAQIGTIGSGYNELEYPDAFNKTGAVEKLKRVYPYSSGQAIATSLSIGAPILAFMVTGEAGNAYEYEVVTHCEVVGPTASTNLTPNNPSIGGADIAATAFYNTERKRTTSRSGEAMYGFEFAKAAEHAGKRNFSRGPFVWPGYNYLGPGNPMDEAVPTSKLDALAKSHDEAYGKAEGRDDVLEADLNFIKEAFYEDGIVGPIASVAIGTKVVAESLFGNIYPSFS